MDPISQILSQSQAASAGGRGFGEFYVQGVQARQGDRRIDIADRQQGLAERQFEQESQLMPLRKRAAELQNEALGLEVLLKMDQFQRSVDIRKSQSEALRLQNDAYNTEGGFANPEILRRYYELMSRNPSLMATDQGKGLTANIQGAIRMKELFGLAEKSGLPPQKIEGEDGSGNKITFESEKTANKPLGAEFIQLMRARDEARAAGDEATAADIERRMAFLNTRGESEITTTSPDGTTTTVRTGAGSKKETPPGTPTVSTKSKAQEQISSAIQTLETGRELIPMFLNPKTSGARGALNLDVSDFLGGAIPALRDSNATITDTKNRFFNSSVARSLRTDGQMAEPERKKIEGSLPQIGYFQGDQVSRTLEAMNQVAERARLAAVNAGEPIPEELLRPDIIKIDEAKDLFRRNLISREKMLEIANYGTNAVMLKKKISTQRTTK